MTSASMTTLGDQEKPPSLISRGGWVIIGIIGLLFVLLHWNFLRRTLMIATEDNNWSHSLVVPFIAIYYIYQNRDRLIRMPRRISWLGLGIFFAGLIGYALWIYPGRNDMFQGYSMILALFGLVLFLLGRHMMSVLWFPIVYLGFGVKVSQRLWDFIAVKLQWVAANCATAVLKFCTFFIDFDVTNRGSTIDLTVNKAVVVNGITMMQPVTNSLNVAEACAGLRMLMAFLALGVAMAFLWERANWQRLVMALMAVPIAVAINVGRVTVIGLLYLYDPAMAKGDFHIFVGMLMLIPAGGLFLLLGWVLDRIMITDHHRRAQPRPVSSQPHTPSMQLIDKIGLGKGIGAGVAVTLLVGFSYALALAVIRPDLFSQSLAPALVYTLLGGCVLLLLGVIVSLPMLMFKSSRQGSPGDSARPRSMAVGIIAGMLITATIGQSAVIAATETVLVKKAVPLRDPLFYMRSPLGVWHMSHEYPPLSSDQQSELGTDKYFTRDYEDKTWPRGTPGRMVTVHVAYYTGTADTVPHVPERCITAGGADAVGGGRTTLHLDGPEYSSADGRITTYSQTTLSKVNIPSKDIPATYFTFAHPNGRNKSNVIYFFATNGKFLPSPDAVRFQGFDPRDKYAYYCKIEMRFHGMEDIALSVQRAEALMSALLPEIMACLPDWQEVIAGRWPRKP